MRDQPLTPPADISPHDQHLQSEPPSHVSARDSSTNDDNTALGMAISQETSMYLTPAASPTTLVTEEKEVLPRPPTPAPLEEERCKHTGHLRELDPAMPHDAALVLANAKRPPEAAQPMNGNAHADAGQADEMDVDEQDGAKPTPRTQIATPGRTFSPRGGQLPLGLAQVDLELDRTRPSVGWDFTDKRPSMKCPSALFQPYSKYVGTQQSDRHTYNVEVTILTVDMAQCSISGYLLINGLTPEHPTLQTFFTGQIVGGPKQRYSFKTTDPAWGANDKVDLQHWLRFPPWRQLSAHAKRDMRFEFPLNGEPWWTQDHVFMRWKEHFLVPDHRQSNITGASFEGFYYICLNMAEGKISGVYFHSKSERYQQLELTHETKRGLGIFGVSPLVELR